MLGFTNDNPATNSRRYRFTMIIYRDCQGSGANFDSAPNSSFPCHVSIYRGNVLDTVLVLAAPTRTRLNPNPGNPCVAVPGNVCVEEGIYVFPVIDLPISTESYHVVYQRCCRNNTITNIVAPGQSGATYTVELTAAAQQLGNSSPRFSGYPPIVLCAGEDFVFDFSATDADGDQIVYEFCSPFLGGGLNFDDPENSVDGLAPDPELGPPYAPVAFQAPAFSPSIPLGQESNMQLNVFTGVLTGAPAQVGQFVVGVCISEYRNGVLLSTVRRDFQFNVTACTNLVSANIREDSIAADGAFIISECGQNRVQIFNESGSQAFINAYQWEIYMSPDSTLRSTSRDLTINFPGPGVYLGRMVINPGSSQCSDTAFVKINVFPAITADFSFAYDSCKVQPVQFADLTQSPGGAVARYDWQFGDGATANLASPSHQYLTPGERLARLIVRDVNGCMDTIARRVRYFPAPPVIVVSPSSYTGCPPAEIFFNNLSEPVNNSYEVIWDFGDGNTTEAISPTHVFEEDGTFDVSVSITSPIGCVTDTVFRELITIDPAPVAGFIFDSDSLTNFNPEVRIIDQSTGAYRWYWDLNGEAFSLQPSPVYSFRDTGLAYVRQVVTHPSGCIDSLIRYIDVKPIITLHFPNAFTPNDDSVNDSFVPKGYLRGYRSYQLRVWNRWGEVIFDSKDPLMAWNGRKGNTGQAAPPGVYLYEYKLVGPRGEIEENRGSITLLR